MRVRPVSMHHEYILDKGAVSLGPRMPWTPAFAEATRASGLGRAAPCPPARRCRGDASTADPDVRTERQRDLDRVLNGIRGDGR